MPMNVVMPQGGQDIETGTLVRWWKSEGDPVLKGETICEIETEKAVFEVSSPMEGVLLRIVVKDGESAPILSVIGVVGDANEKVETVTSLVDQKIAQAKQIEALTHTSIYLNPPPAPEKKRRIEISPKAKKLAMDKGIPIDAIHGSGPGGRIMEADVLAAIQARSKEPQQVPEAPEATMQGTPSTSGKTLALSKQGKVIARRMTASKQTAPHFYVSLSVDMTRLLKFRSELSEAHDPLRVPSINDFIVKACALSLREIPEVNASFASEDQIRLWSEINLGIAIALPEGLVIQVLENADQVSLFEISVITRKMINLAREGKQISLAPSHFTISNLGMYNIDSFAAIINPPEAAILAVGSIHKQVIPTEAGELEVHDLVSLTLSMDHRIGDGVLAARFLNQIRSLLEQPLSLL
jgi:pyruvate dehydrogenase E2 component (dihydrolipoamide acetyltransferase)